ncbi:MAG TPA: hypothetical protein PLU53_08775 [Bacteroidia bacterium]|nr:hypothetical protein [Bacteroidia bacterium]
MKSKLVINLVLLLLFTLQFVQAQSTFHGRGLYVDRFFRLNGQCSVDPNFTVLGFSSKEDELLNYAKTNHITYLLLYDIYRVFQNISINYQGKTAGEHLCDFIAKAKNDYCIDYIGVAGSDGGFFEDFIPQNPTPPIILSPAEITSLGSSNPLICIQNSLMPGDSLYAFSETCKFFLRVAEFNTSNAQRSGVSLSPSAFSCSNGAYFDVITTEYEWWNNTSPDDFGYSLPSDKYPLHYQPLITAMDGVKALSIHPLLVESYLAVLDDNQSTDWSNNICPQTYSNHAAIAAWVDGIDPGTGLKRVDRAILTYYTGYNVASGNYHPDIYNLNNTSSCASGDFYSNAFYENRFLDFCEPSTEPLTNIQPTFCSQSFFYDWIGVGGGANFLGDWFSQGEVNNIWKVEKDFYNNWYSDANSNVHNPISKNEIIAGSVQWFSSPSMLQASKFQNPLQSNSPVCSGESVTFSYEGPVETGSSWDFYVVDNLTQQTIPSSVSIGNVWLDYVPPVEPIIIPSLLGLADGDYTAFLTLHYNSSDCFHEFTLPLHVGASTELFATADHVCAGSISNLSNSHESVILKANYSPNASYSWSFSPSFGNASISSTNNICIFNPPSCTAFTSTNPVSFTINCTISGTGVCNTILSKVITVYPNPVFSVNQTCAGISDGVRLSVNSNFSPSNGNYLWSDYSTNSTLIVNQNGFYSVNVTQNNGGCSQTLSFYVNNLPKIPRVTSTAFDVCSPGIFTLSVQNTESGVTYQWYRNSLAISGANSTSYTENNLPNITASYTYYVSSTLNGCSVNSFYNSSISDCQLPITEVIAHDYPIVNAGNDQTVCYNSTVQLNGSISGSVTGGLWSTTIGDGSFSSSTILNPTYTPGSNDIANGSVILTLTSNDPVGPCGPISASVNIMVDPSCCDVNGNSDLHQSDFNVSQQINHTDYDLNENVAIQNGTGIVITDCDISVGQGFTITIKQGGSLTLNGSTHLHGCSGMWGGIVVEPGGQFYIDGSSSAMPVIEDAEYGVYIEMVSSTSLFHSGVKIRKAVFSSNYTDIYLQENSSGDINQVNIDVFGCLFNKSHDLFFTPNISPLGSSPFAGIVLHNFNGIIGSFYESTNEFKDHNLGLQCINSNITVNNCRFQNIQPESVYGNYFDGTGIHVIGSNNQYTFHQTGLGEFSSISTFESCKNGIYVEGSGGYSHYNYMTDVENGITLTQLLPKVQFLVFTNNLECKYQGIVSNFNKEAEQIEIIGNTITMDDPVHLSGNAIGIYDYLSSCPNLIVLDNHITLNHSHGGIDVYGTKGISVSQNIINMNYDSESKYGIGLWSADKNTITCNDVQGVSLDVANSKHIGYKTSISQANQIQCNNAYTTNTGFEFNNQCPATDFAGNSVASDQWIGLRVLNQGVMGVQVHKGNKWYPPFHSAGNTEAENTNVPNASLSQFDVNPFDGIIYSPSNPSPPGWFHQDPNGHAFDCGSSSICGFPNLESYVGSIDNLDNMIALGSYHTSEFDSENVWMAKKYLFEKIVSNPLMLNDPIIYSFFIQETATATEEFQEVKAKILSASGVQESHSGQFLGNYKNIDSLQKELEIADSINVSLNGSNAAVLATINLIKQQIASIIAGSNNMVANDKAESELKADSTKLLNSGIDVSEQYKANEKEVNEIYLSTLAKGNRDFTGTQIQGLLTVAHQCPYAGGKYVYLARAIYHLVNPFEEYYDDDLCAQLGYFRRSHSNKNPDESIFVYPNPANETIKFENTGFDTWKEVQISGLDNRIVKKLYLTIDSRTIEIKTDDLAPGLYVYHINFINGAQENGKFTIMH